MTDEKKRPSDASRPRDGRGKGVGMSGGQRGGRNTAPCPNGGAGHGKGEGRGKGKNRER